MINGEARLRILIDMCGHTFTQEESDELRDNRDEIIAEADAMTNEDWAVALEELQDRATHSYPTTSSRTRRREIMSTGFKATWAMEYEAELDAVIASERKQMYAVKAEYFYYQGTYQAPDDQLIAAFDTQPEAVAHIATLPASSGRYDLSHGEYARPSYTVLPVSASRGCEIQARSDVDALVY